MTSNTGAVEADGESVGFIEQGTEDKFEKDSTKLDINNQNNFESINQQNYKINSMSFNEIGAIKGTKNSNLDNSVDNN